MNKTPPEARARTVWGRYKQLPPHKRVIMGVIGAGLSITALLLLEQQEASQIASAPFEKMPRRDPARTAAAEAPPER